MLPYMKELSKYSHIVWNQQGNNTIFLGFQWISFPLGPNIWLFPLVAELKLKMSQIEQFFYVLNFISAIRGRFSNVYTFLASLATWSRKDHTDF